MGVFACFGLMAVARLRTAKVIDPSAKAPPVPKTGDEPAPPFVRPPVTDGAVAWHERYRETRWRKTPAPWENVRWQVLVGIGVVICAHLVRWLLPNADDEVARVVVGACVWVMGLVALFAASGRAAAAVAREREKDTLEGLMLTGLGCREILRQKWLGCVTALVPLYVVMLGAMAAGVVTGTLHPASAVLVALTVPVHAGFAASLGLNFSVRAKNPARAGWVMWVTVLGVAWASSLPIVAVFQALGEPDALQGPLAVALIPPGATGAMLMALNEAAFQPSRPDEAVRLLVAAVIGTLMYAGMGRALFDLAVRRFEREWGERQ